MCLVSIKVWDLVSVVHEDDFVSSWALSPIRSAGTSLLGKVVMKKECSRPRVGYVFP